MVGCQQLERGVHRKEEHEHKHRVWEDPGTAGNDRSPGGPVTGECAEEQWEDGRKVCGGHVVKSLACQESAFYTAGTAPRRIFEPSDKHNISFRSINFP